jgi:hypothetical protein
MARISLGGVGELEAMIKFHVVALYHCQMSVLTLCPTMPALQIGHLISLLGDFRPHAGFAWCGKVFTITSLPPVLLALSRHRSGSCISDTIKLGVYPETKTEIGSDTYFCRLDGRFFTFCPPLFSLLFKLESVLPDNGVL